MKSLAASRPGMGYVPTRDLPKLTAGDNMGVHYSGKAQISIGARFAYEAARLVLSAVVATMLLWELRKHG